jgi:phage-related protein
MAGPLDRAFVEIIGELDVRQMQRAAQTAGRTVERELTRGVERAERRASRDSSRIGLSAGADFGDGFSVGLSATLSSLAGIRLPVAGFGVLGSAMAAAAAAATQLAAAMAPAVGIIAALPSGVGLLAAGMSTLQVATLGVGEAFETAATGTAEEFNAAIEGMAPNVQAAAQAIRDMAPALDELRDSVQQEFFANFDQILVQLSETLLGPVRDGMTAVAESMNGVITGLAQVATSQVAVDFVTTSFNILNEAVARLQEPLANLFSSLLNLGVAVNQAFGENVGAGLASLVDRLAVFIDRAVASGQAVQWVRDALRVFNELGSVISSVTGILSSIGNAARTSGGNILGVFGEVLRVFDEFLASAQGQQILVTIFEALNTVGAAFGTVLAAIAPAIPPIIEGIAGLLSVVAPLLGPLAELVGSVLTALAPILDVIATAIAPLIEPFTQIANILGAILVEAITAIMPLLEAIAEALGAGLSVALEVVAVALQAIAPILGVLFEALGPLIEALAPFNELFVVLAEIIGAVLVPIIQVLADILLWVVENVIVPVLVPAIEFLADILTTVLGGSVQNVAVVFQAAIEGIAALFEWVRNQFENRAEEMANIFTFLSDSMQAAKDVMERFVFTPIRNGITFVKDTVLGNITSMVSGLDRFAGFVRGIPDKISSALRNMFAPMAEGFRSFINDVIAGWNSLSFTIPSVNVPGFGTVGGGTISTPNIPYLADGALATGPTLAMIGEGRFNEAVLPLGDPRVDSLLASALSRAGVMNQGDAGAGNSSVSAVAQAGDNYFVVKIGERELTDIIVEQQNEMNQDMLRRARAGTGRRG